MNANSDDKYLLRYDKTGYIYPLSYPIIVKRVFNDPEALAKRWAGW